MNWRRGLGITLIFVGIFLITTGRVLTGAVIGTGPENLLGWLGILVLVMGMVILAVETLEKKVEKPHEAHNVAKHEKLKERYRFIEAHGAPPEDEKAWVTMYHGYIQGSKPDFSEGLKTKKTGEEKGSGFYFTPSAKETYEFLRDQRGIRPENAEIIQVKISKNVYNPDDGRGIVKRGASPDKNYFYIPANKFKKANKLIKKGLIKIGEKTS